MDTSIASNEQLRADIGRLVEAANQAEIDHDQAVRLMTDAHAAEIAELMETARLLAIETDNQHAADRKEVDNIRRALESRDLIGQAKGVLAVALQCTPEQAFALIVTQSQHENRKLVEIASEIVERTIRRAKPRVS